MAQNKDRRKKKGRFLGIPWNVVNSEAFSKLKAAEVKLLLDLLLQYTGKNNGNLSPCHSLMKKRGWAKSSLYRAFVGLEQAGFVVITRQGMKVRGFPTLVAITWNGIDDPRKGEYDEGIKVESRPLGYWCIDQSKWKHQPKLKPKQKNITTDKED